MVTSEQFWDRVAEKYARDPIKNLDNYNDTLNRTRRYLGAEDSVLEIASGTASTALLLAPGVQSYLATDVSAEMVRIGREKGAREGLENLSHGVGTAFEGAGSDQMFDAVLAFNFLHLADDPRATMRAVYQRLKPGGVFVSKSACMGDWLRVMRGVIWIMQKLGKAPHVAYFSAAGFDAMLRDAGFDIVESHTYSVKPPSHFVVARRPV